MNGNDLLKCVIEINSDRARYF